MTPGAIGVITSGGDAPGMNAALRAVVRTAARLGRRTVGFRRGFSGLMDGEAMELGPRDVANILQRGGSIIDTSRDARFKTAEGRSHGIATLEEHGCSALVVIGGEGSQHGSCALLAEWDGAVVGVASTIDNDLGGTDQSIGFDTACNTALEAIDRIRDTANALDRLFFVEVMGRNCGFIALDVAIGGGAEAVLVPEEPFDMDRLVKLIRGNYDRGKISCIVVVAEGAHPGGARGLVHEMEDQLGALGLTEAGAGARITILGHIQRGGNPSVRDRVTASRLGAAAGAAAAEGRGGIVFGMRGREVVATRIEDAIRESRTIDHDLLDLVNVLA